MSSYQKALLERRQARSNQLVNAVLLLKNAGHTTIKICKICKFASPTICDNCGYCQHSKFEIIQLDDDYVYRLANRYWDHGYANDSLAIIPHINEFEDT
jgi:hypothetical protein